MEDELQRMIRNLSPKPKQQAILFYGREYRLYIGRKYLGTAIWTKDALVGDSFQSYKMEGETKIVEVYCPDRWELIIKNKDENLAG